MPCKLSIFLQRDAAIIGQPWAPPQLRGLQPGPHGRTDGGHGAAEALTAAGPGAVPARPGAHASPKSTETSLNPPVLQAAWLPAGTAPV